MAGDPYVYELLRSTPSPLPLSHEGRGEKKEGEKKIGD
jgi:hypothetical protein